MTVIGTNVAALRASAASNSASSMLSTAQQRLSTGKRINSARDDAAGLAIATSMQSQITGMNQGIRNANDGISMAQTAEGSLDEVTNMLQRMRELKVQSSNGTYSATDIANMKTEQDALAGQITSVLTNTQFNGKNLFDGSAGNNGAVTIQAGANASDTVTLNLTKLTTDTDLAKVLAAAPAGDAGASSGAGDAGASSGAGDAGASSGAGDAGASSGAGDAGASSGAGDAGASSGAGDAGASSGSGAATITPENAVANSNATLADYDSAIAKIATTRAGLGATENRLSSAVNNLTTNSTNLSDAQSRIQDADFSAESTNLAKAQILSQASTAMLAQANQSTSNVMTLLR